jgi:hypothetical protein
MHIAVQLYNTEIGKALKKNRFINSTILNHEGDSALILAVKLNKIKMLNILLTSSETYCNEASASIARAELLFYFIWILFTHTIYSHV